MLMSYVSLQKASGVSYTAKLKRIDFWAINWRSKDKRTAKPQQQKQKKFVFFFNAPI